MHQTFWNSRTNNRQITLTYRWLLLGLLVFSVGCPSGSSSLQTQLDEVVEAGDSGADAERDAVVTATRELQIATFNVKRFFDTICDSGSCGGRSYEALPDEAEFSRRAEELAEAIVGLDADVVLLQEIESEVCLEAINSKVTDRYSVSVFGEVGYAASLDVGVLSRGELREVRRHRPIGLTRPDGSETRFSREFLEVHLNIDGGYVVVFNAHFKSKANDDPGRRFAEAAAAHKIVLNSAAELPRALVVFGGDLNDTPGSEPLNAIEEGGKLFRVGSELESDWTFADFRGTAAIDHLYLALPAEGRHVSGSAEVFRDGRGAWGGSDHAAHGARFLVPLP